MKLNDAESLFMSQDRPLLAEILIHEAMEIYTERGDEHGLGNANREYADLLQSASVSETWAAYYRENGFHDQTITFENRIAKSFDYYTTAISHYSRAELQLRDEMRFDALTNVYFNMAWSYYQIGDKSKACGYYDQTLAAYNENIRLNPAATPVGNVPDVVTNYKGRAGCV